MKGERIANTFQRWLLLVIILAFAATSIFTYFVQDGIVNIETQEVFTTAIGDVEADIVGKSNAQLLTIAEAVKEEYEKDPSISLVDLAETYGIIEINVVDERGIIINSTEPDVVNTYDMNSKEQSKSN